MAAPVVVGAAYLGGWWFAGGVALVAAAAQLEFYAMGQTAGLRPLRSAGVSLGACCVMTPQAPWMGAASVLGLVLLLVAAPWAVDRERFLENLALTVAGVVYPAGLLAALVALRGGGSAELSGLAPFWLVLLTFFLVWATDIFAYYVGRTVGSRPLAPAISPNKTWEGTLGGAAAAVGMAVAFKLTVLPMLSWVDAAVLAVLGGGVSQVGDLVESQLKRSTGTKDAGSLLPGHGGMLDRFDSMIVAAPLIYLYLRFGAGLL